METIVKWEREIDDKASNNEGVEGEGVGVVGVEKLLHHLEKDDESDVGDRLWAQIHENLMMVPKKLQLVPGMPSSVHENQICRRTSFHELSSLYFYRSNTCNDNEKPLKIYLLKFFCEF